MEGVGEEDSLYRGAAFEAPFTQLGRDSKLGIIKYN